MPLELELLGI